ncbi:MAG TPA: MerR family transcriptional regulator [Candidatus Aminicenantes bacterium]|nr:MerR family transcriptional regulator [Candidatus Aminicenantes bacterium]
MSKNASPPNPLKDEKPKDKLVFKVDEVCRLTGVDAATLAAWEEDFPFLSAGLTGSGEKFFRRQDVAVIGRIRELAASNTLTKAGIKRRVEEEFGLAPAHAVPPEKLRKALSNVRDELQEIVSSLGGGRKKRA